MKIDLVGWLGIAGTLWLFAVFAYAVEIGAWVDRLPKRKMLKWLGVATACGLVVWALVGMAYADGGT